MAVREPESMAELVYFTRRVVGAGAVRCWVFKEKCVKCKKGVMGKPVEKGKVKVRAKEYVCPACAYAVEKTAYEESLVAHLDYVCPLCKHAAQKQVPFKRKKVQGVDTLQFACDKCGGTINVTKKMKNKGDPAE